ncbi:MAG: SIMPL domain-containing protein [Deltaproteobacteria bacterium]
MEQNTGSIFKTISAIVISIGIIWSSYIISDGVIRAKGNVKGNDNLITITGSAKQQIKSDLIVWNCSFSGNSPTLVEAYDELNKKKAIVKKYLISKGINEKSTEKGKEESIVFSSISTMPVYKILQRQGENNQVYDYTSNIIESYTLEQNVEIKSYDVDKITEISRTATELISQGINLRSSSPQYFYTKLADLKIDMLARATADAKNRATKMAENAGTKCGKLRSANMGVFQITPIYSNEVSDYGINDTSSLEKEIMSVVTCRFEVK